MSRHVCITAAEGQTGHLIAELLLTGEDYSKKVDSVTALTMDTTADNVKQLKSLGAKIVPHKPGKEREVVKTLSQTKCDTLCLIPPASKDKFEIVAELVRAAKKANIPNVCFISSAGCDLAERDKQPRLREFVDLETLVMTAKGEHATRLGQSPCIIRAGFYAENLLLYTPQLKEEKVLPLPIGENHQFAPVALGDIAQLAATVLIGKGKHGFDDKHRGQLMIMTGPTLCSGQSLASNATKALGTEIHFEDISPAEAKKVLKSQTEIDPSEAEYLLDYYSLVREGKTNYICTAEFHYVTGNEPTQPEGFFKLYAESLRPEGGSHKRRKVENGS